MSGIGTLTIWSKVSVEATKVTQSGNATTTTPITRTRCATKSPMGRFSTMPLPGCLISVLDLALDVAELHDRERGHHEHEDHRLRRRAAQVRGLHAVVVHLVDQD